MTDYLNTPTSPSEKIQTLKKARALLEDGYATDTWYALIDGAEHFCLYGAIQAAMGVDHRSEIEEIIEARGYSEDDFNRFGDEWLADPINQLSYEPMEYDRVINKCSLTSAMYDASGLNDAMVNRAQLLSDVDWKRDHPSTITTAMSKGDRILHYKATALQRMNDEGNREAVLEVLDKTIAKYEDEIGLHE